MSEAVVPPDHPACKADCAHFRQATGDCGLLARDGFRALQDKKITPCQTPVQARLASLAAAAARTAGRRSPQDAEDVKQSLAVVLLESPLQKPTLGSLLNGLAPSAAKTAVRDALGIRVEIRRCGDCAHLGPYSEQGSRLCEGPSSATWGKEVVKLPLLAPSCLKQGGRKSPRIDVCSCTSHEQTAGKSILLRCNKKNSCSFGQDGVGFNSSAADAGCSSHEWPWELVLGSVSYEELSHHEELLRLQDPGSDALLRLIEAFLAAPSRKVVVSINWLREALSQKAPALEERVLDEILRVVVRLLEEQEERRP